MSVRVGDRTESKLKVLDSARKLKKYTIDKIKDFPKSTRWLYAIPMSNCVRQACSSIRRANSVNVKMESDYMKRRNYQLDASTALAEMYELIDDALDASYIDYRQEEFWTGLILECETKLSSWMESDRKRFMSFTPPHHPIEIF